MTILQTFTTSCKLQLAQAGQNLASDTLMMALYTSAASLNDTTTAYTNTGEVSATGYTAGGQVLTGVTVTAVTTGTVPPAVVCISFTNPVWTGAFTARCALIYNATRGNASVAVLDFGSDKTSSNTFTVTLPGNTSTTALLRIA